MKVAKSILRNDGYNLTPIDFTVYLKLLELKEQMSGNIVYFNPKLFRESIFIKDTRTIKKSLYNLFMNGLISNKIDKLGSFYTEIIINDDVNIVNDNIEIDANIFTQLEQLGHIGLRIACYLMTYYDYSINRYPHFFPLQKIIEDLVIEHSTLRKYLTNIKNNVHYSYLGDEESCLGKIFYSNNEQNKNKKNNNILEKQLERQLIENIQIIEEGMIFIHNQYQIKDGIIDILCRDKHGKLCIIELKVVEDDEKLVFQCVYYPTQFKEKVRMITIAPNYNYKIQTALQSLGYVEMKRYIYDEQGNLNIIS